MFLVCCWVWNQQRTSCSITSYLIYSGVMFVGDLSDHCIFKIPIKQRVSAHQRFCHCSTMESWEHESITFIPRLYPQLWVWQKHWVKLPASSVEELFFGNANFLCQPTLWVLVWVACYLLCSTEQPNDLDFSDLTLQQQRVNFCGSK